MTEEEKASNEPAPQEPSETPQPTPDAQNQGEPAKAPAPAKEEKWEFDGNFDKLKDDNPELYKYATGIRRYATRKDQDHAAQLKSAQEYEQVKAMPAWNQFLQSYQNPGQAPAQPTTEETYVDPDTQKYVEGKEKVYVDKIAHLEKEMGQMKSEGQIALFAASNPKFWDYDDMGLIRPLLREGKSLTEATSIAEGIVQKIRKESVQVNNQRVQEKMNAANTVGPSVLNESDIVYVDHPSKVLDAATELAMKGETHKKVRVRKSTP